MNAPRTLWPFAIAGVLTVFVGANAFMFAAARDRHADAVEPDYYRKALAWDSTLAERARSDRLGWRIEATLGTREAAGTPLRVRVTDADGAVVFAERGEVVAIHNAIADEPVRAVLVPAADGSLAARLPLARDGMWELRLTIVRGADRFTASRRADTGGAP